MDWDDTRQPPTLLLTVGDDLTTLSVEDLRARVAALEAEIRRTEAELASKEARRSAADAFFRKTSGPLTGT